MVVIGNDVFRVDNRTLRFDSSLRQNTLFFPANKHFLLLPSSDATIGYKSNCNCGQEHAAEMPVSNFQPAGFQKTGSANQTLYMPPFSITGATFFVAVSGAWMEPPSTADLKKVFA